MHWKLLQKYELQSYGVEIYCSSRVFSVTYFETPLYTNTVHMAREKDVENSIQ